MTNLITRGDDFTDHIAFFFYLVINLNKLEKLKVLKGKLYIIDILYYISSEQNGSLVFDSTVPAAKLMVYTSNMILQLTKWNSVEY